MDFEWYKKLTAGYFICVICWASMFVFLLFTVDYLPMLYFFGGVAFVFTLFSFLAFFVCVLDFNNQRKIFELKGKLKIINEILEKRVI